MCDFEVDVEEILEKSRHPFPEKVWINRDDVNIDLLAAHLVEQNLNLFVVSDIEPPYLCIKDSNGDYYPLTRTKTESLIRAELPIGYASVDVLKKTARILMATVPNSITAAEASNNCLAVFIEKYCIKTGGKFDRIRRSEFNRRVKAYLASNGIAPLNNMTKRMAQLGFKVKNSGDYYYTELKWKIPTESDI
jgi:hypothetical protein